MRRNGFMAQHFPGPAFKTGRFCGECPDRTNINHITGQFRVDTIVNKSRDYRMFATSSHSQFTYACYFLTKTHTTCTVDAAG